MRITCTPLSSMQVGVGQQREEARALDRLGQLPLVAGRGAGDARRDDLAGLVDEVLQHLDVLVVDPLHLLGREAAELAAAEQRPLPLVLLVLGELAFALAFTSARRPISDFDFSSFIIGDGEITALGIFTIRWRSTASLNLNECSSSASVSFSHSMFIST